MANLYVTYSVLMATLFVIAAFIHINDKDWFFWIYLYGAAAYVNLMILAGIVSYERTINVGKLIYHTGQAVFWSVIFYSGFVSTLSMDMSDRLLRGIGSALVMACMNLQIAAAEEFVKDPAKKVKLEVSTATKNGMARLVCFGYSFFVAFLAYNQRHHASNY